MRGFSDRTPRKPHQKSSGCAEGWTRGRPLAQAGFSADMCDSLRVMFDRAAFKPDEQYFVVFDLLHPGTELWPWLNQVFGFGCPGQDPARIPEMMDFKLLTQLLQSDRAPRDPAVRTSLMDAYFAKYPHVSAEISGAQRAGAAGAERQRDSIAQAQGGPAQVDPGFSHLTPRLLSALETKI